GADLLLAVAAPVRMVHRVLRRAADGRELAAPASAACLAARDVLVIDVADLAHRRATGERHAAHLPGRQPEDAVALVLRDELDARARRTRHLAALARLHLHVLDHPPAAGIRQRQGIAGLDVGIWARLDDGADAQASRREDVGLRAVRVVEQRDPGRPVRVVLDRGHLCGDSVPDALEIDLAVEPLVTAALMAPGDAAVHVPATALLQRLGQVLLGLGLRDLVEGRDRPEPPSRRSWLVPTNGHAMPPPR